MSLVRCHYVQHVAHEGPGTIETWARERGHEVTATRVDRGDSLPDPADPDLLVVLGGPMGVGDGDEFGWLPAERALLREALDAGTVCLGVCLGAQQLAAALGGTVGPHVHTERGWLPVEATRAGRRDPVFGALPERYVPLHWHGDSFSLPPDATLAATSEACETQAFTWNGRAYGLQFHLETTAAGLADLLDATDGVGNGPYEDAPAAMRDDERLAALSAHCEAFLDALAARHGWQGEG